MADKGFTIEDILPLGVSFNIPPFLGMSDQMSAEDVIATQEIARLRIHVHVERVINKVKNFLILEGVIPLSLFGVVNQIWCVCAMLCNILLLVLKLILSSHRVTSRQVIGLYLYKMIISNPVKKYNIVSQYCTKSA